jgi:hypothetical protein
MVGIHFFITIDHSQKHFVLLDLEFNFLADRQKYGMFGVSGPNVVPVKPFKNVTLAMIVETFVM